MPWSCAGKRIGRPLDTLIDALRPRQLLIVLDNCEHLIEACAQTAGTLLRRCPTLKILASSREALNIEGETIWAVPSLTVPEFDYRDPNPKFEKLEELEAVQLFVERAAAGSARLRFDPRRTHL
jgi:non-specific serine/threonine protein kinase